MELLYIGLLGGLLALDTTSVGQFMFSRPLVAGAVTGWVLGDLSLGLTIGVVLETYMLVSFPSGGARFPDGTTATVVAVAAASVVPSAGALPLAVGAGLFWGQVGGWSVTTLRKLNGRLVPESSDPSVTVRRVPLVQLSSVLLDFLRGVIVTVVGAGLGRLVVSALADSWPLAEAPSLGLLVVGGAVSVGILLHDLGGFRKRRVLFVAGLALGIIGARFL